MRDTERLQLDIMGKEEKAGKHPLSAISLNESSQLSSP